MSARLAACALCVTGPGAVAHGQIWQVTNAGGSLRVTGFVENNETIPFFTYDTTAAGMLANFQGASYGNRVFDYRTDNKPAPPPPSAARGDGRAKVLLFGDLSQQVIITWEASTKAEVFADGYFVQTDSDINNVFFELNTFGAPPGFPLTVHYSWDMRSFIAEGPEMNELDISNVSDAELWIGTTEVLGGRFDVATDHLVTYIDYALRNQSGSFTLSAGTPIVIQISAFLIGDVDDPGKVGAQQPEDIASAYVKGSLRLFLDVPPAPGPIPGLPGLPPAFLDFSADIGGDAELSDPPGIGGEEVFDPGDVYMWAPAGMGGASLPYPGGADGYIDDQDRWPGPLADPAPGPGVPGTPAPRCSGVVPPPSGFFDLDGHEEWDDDVDSLDAVPASGNCPHTYFGADHEAAFFLNLAGGDLSALDPGAVYRSVAGAGIVPIKVVDPVVHLGLQPGFDMADFEFVYLPDPVLPAPAEVLGILFAVHPDDPTTIGVDESSGLDPRRLYASYFTGTSFEFLGPIGPDPVDALTLFGRDLADPPEPPPIWCEGDADSSGFVTFADILSALAHWGANYGPGGMGPGDADCDGFVNFNDVLIVLARWGTVCNPSP